MQTRSRIAWLLLPAAAILLVLGCSDSSSPRSVLSVTSINLNRPLQSDVVQEIGGQYVIVEDAVSLAVTNQPHDGALAIDPQGPFGRVTLERYTVHFECSETIADVQGSLGWIVPSGQTVQGTIIVVPADLKTVPPLVSLIETGEIEATARITIYGREATSDDRVKFETTLPIRFANWAN